MILFTVVGTAPAHMGPCIAEAGCTHVLHSFAAMRGDVPIPMDKLTEIMLAKFKEKKNASVPGA